MILRIILFCSVFLLFRVFSLQSASLVNSTPVMGLLVCMIAFYGKKGAIYGVVFWLLSFPIFSMLQGYFSLSGLYSSLLGICLVYFVFINYSKESPKNLLLNTLGASLLFYLVTNLVCWLTMPLYAKSLVGFYEALWAGKPEFATPTWVFFRNTMLGNFAFSLIVVLANVRWPMRKEEATITSFN